jgi:hypothetical protein
MTAAKDARSSRNQALVYWRVVEKGLKIPDNVAGSVPAFLAQARPGFDSEPEIT